MKKQIVVTILIAFVLAIVDEIIKYFALLKLPTEGSFELSKLIDLAVHKNFGIAFDLPLAQPITIVITIILLILFSVIAWRYRNTKPQITIAAGLIIAGALGNLFDRVVYGFTVDYLILLGRSAINISDLLILTGVVWLILTNKKTKANN